MASIPQIIPVPPPEGSASFDFQDIEEGIGFVSFLAATTSGSTILTRGQVYSNEISTIVSVVTGGHTKEIDKDFDTSQFNLPRLVKGTALVSIPLMVQSTGGGVRTSAYTIADIKHWDGTTETSLGRSTSGSVLKSANVASAVLSGSQLHKIALTQKNFKVGDILRFTLEGYSVDGTGLMEIGHDPQNRISNNNFNLTKLVADIPFRLEL